MGMLTFPRQRVPYNFRERTITMDSKYAVGLIAIVLLLPNNRKLTDQTTATMQMSVAQSTSTAAFCEVMVVLMA
jgi:hypothetical protein